MSSNSRVIWSEGLFLRPQHLQQQDRFVEHFVDARCRGVHPFGWGFVDIEADPASLTSARFGLLRASGIFPDGTLFRLPEDGPLPLPVEVEDRARGELVFLGIPLRGFDHLVSPATEPPASGGPAHIFTRYRAVAIDVVDASSDAAATIEVAALQARLLTERQDRAAYACLPVARIERIENGAVVLDRNFIPTVLHLSTATPLMSFVREIHGRLRQRQRQLSGGASARSSGGDFLFLQTVNRYEPVFEHYTRVTATHPEELYRTCVSAVGDLSTFRPGAVRRDLPPYDHDALNATFVPVMDELRELVDLPIDQKAVRIFLTLERPRSWIGDIPDTRLFEQADFYFVARTVKPSAQAEAVVRQTLEHLTKVTSIPVFDSLQAGVVSGVTLRREPKPPPELPLRAGSVCFRLLPEGRFWSDICRDQNVKIQDQGPPEKDDVDLELWAIRR